MDEYVISGIAGRFPDADNVGELHERLLSKEKLYREAELRWAKGSDFKNVLGTIKDLTKFDANFFNTTRSAADSLEPEQRILLEITYEAIVDAGYDPNTLRGRRVGVYVGVSNTEAHILTVEQRLDHNASGHISAMCANRLSYFFDFTGPSLVLDTACSSSMTAMDLAICHMKHGYIEAAIVASAQLCLHPVCNAMYAKTGILSPSGVVHPFDARADGMIKSEAVVCLFVQKAKDARRVYATILDIQSKASGFAIRGITSPSATVEAALFSDCFRRIGRSPLDVNYVETHGTGAKVGDVSEIKALDACYCVGRMTPLLVGSVKSNLGHTEPSAGMVGIVKAILSFESGIIPPHINFMEPNPDCLALVEGRVKIVTEPTPLEGELISVNCFGFGGVLSHAILQRNPVTCASGGARSPTMPQLVLYSATTDHALKDLFEFITEKKPPAEFYSLLHKSAFAAPNSNNYRGYCIVDQAEERPKPTIERMFSKERKIWYIFDGMGCQWGGMGLDLMQLDAFAQSMKRSAAILKPFGFDLLDVLNPRKDHLKRNRNITPAFIAISAIQIALVDVLKMLEIEPDGIIGHSTGELACSYADGSSTAEQIILSAYYRGISVESSDLSPGQMAAVGLSWAETKRRCPEGVFPACNNAEDSVTISGSTEAVEKFLAELREENIFTRKVNSFGYAFHCKRIVPAADVLRGHLDKVYANPQPRSSKWISTSYVEADWYKPGCKMASAAYFTNNLTSEVHFCEALAKLPSDAIVIEIAPHFLLQSILKRAIGPNASYVGLMKRNEKNSRFTLSAIGQMYNLGLHPQVENLYPMVKFPVPRGTPVISNLIKWDHAQSFFTAKYENQKGGSISYNINLSTKDNYLLDHCINGRSLYPATGYIYLAWNAICNAQGKSVHETSVVIENLKIYRATILDSRDLVSFEVRLLDIKGAFEIKESNSLVASGFIHIVPKPMPSKESDFQFEYDIAEILTRPEIYDELKIQGYEYGPAFRGVVETNIEGTLGYVSWNNEWISFLDSLLLFFGIIQDNRDLKLPTGILSVKINPQQHYEYLSKISVNKETHIPVIFDPYTKCCSTPGVELKNLKLEAAHQRLAAGMSPIHEEYLFVPYMDPTSDISSSKDAISQHGTNIFNEIAEFMAREYNVPITSDQFGRILKNSGNGNFFSVMAKLTEDEELAPVLEALSDKEDGNDLLSRLAFDETFLCSYSKDILHQLAFKEVPLRYLLDIVFENSTGKLQVVELCESGNMISSISNMLRNVLPSRLNYAVLHHDPESVDKAAVNPTRVYPLGKNMEGVSAVRDSANLAIGSFVFGSEESLQKYIQVLASLVVDGGFLLLAYRHAFTPEEQVLIDMLSVSENILSESALEDATEAAQLVVVAKKTIIMGTQLFLFRKIAAVQQRKASLTVIRIVEDDCSSWLEELKDAVKSVQRDANKGSSIWLLAEDSPTNGIIGMVNCLKQEPGGERIRCVFMGDRKQLRSASPFKADDAFYSDIIKKDLLMNVYKNGSWGSFRHRSMPEKEIIESKEYAYINCRRLGDLSSFTWFESCIPYRKPRGSENTLYHVYYSALNFKDVMLATAKLSISTAVQDDVEKDDCFLGLEFSGRDCSGRRVMGMVSKSAMATAVLADPQFVFEVPDHWSLEEAATIPVVYSTCYYAFFMRGKLEKGHRILIHSGTGGIGQAAIRIAMSLNCEVFTTVGSEEKKHFLLKLFPKLQAANIASSRDLSFEDMIMRNTNGKGVDVVLNSLAEDKFQASIRCIGKNGCFLEIGKYDISVDNSLGLSTFLKNVTFHGVFLDYVMAEKDQNLKSQLVNYVEEGIKKGVVQPLSTTVFEAQDVEKAFRYMTSGKHIGKVLLKIREDDGRKVNVPKLLAVDAVKQFYFHSEKSYVVIGGLGGFGIELVKWMISKGARKIVVSSRYGARSSYHKLCLKRWKDQGVMVLVSQLNVVKKDEAKALLQKASTFGPVGGVFNSAVVLRDAFLENQKVQHFREACQPKAAATKHLDELCRSLCPSLDLFVCFSSISCGKGNAGQSNYGFANSVMERICEERRKDGLHGLAIQWGIIGDVGLVHRNMGEDAMIAGVMSQRIKSCLKTLETFLIQPHPVVSSFVKAEITKSKKASEGVFEKLATIFNVKDISEINKSLTLGELGIDSLMGVELQHILENELEEEITMKEIQEMKFDDIITRLSDSSVKEKVAQSTTAPRVINLQPPKQWVSSQAFIPLNTHADGNPLFILHGIEPFLNSLENICRFIERPVYGLRCTRDTPNTSVQDMAQWHLKQIQNICKNGPIHLIGCSSASVLVMEMAIQCERNPGLLPDIRSLAFIDSSLEMMDILSEMDRTRKTNPSHFDASDIVGFLSLFTDTDLSEVMEDLRLLNALDDKLEKVVNMLRTSESCPLIDENFTDSVRHHIAKQHLMRAYRPEVKLKKDLNIIEDSVKVLPNDVASVKSFMSRICDGEINICRMVGNGKLLIGEDFNSVAKFLNEMYDK